MRTVQAMPLLAIAWALAGAGDPQSLDDEVNDLMDLSLEELTSVRVTSATLGERSIDRAPSTMSVITAQQIEQLGLLTLADALRLVPGMTVLDDQFGDLIVAVRGVQNKANILVTLDGQPLNDFYDGHFVPRLLLANVERIEVIRGPGSALYGTNAFSAVISIVTRGAPDEGSVGVLTAAGDANVDDELGYGGRIGLEYRARRGQWRLSTFGQYRESTGPKVKVEEDAASGRPYGATPGMTSLPLATGLAQIVASRTGVFADADTVQLGSVFVLDRHGPYFGASATLTPESNVQRMISSSYVAHDIDIADDVELRTRLSYDVQLVDERIQDQPDGYFFDANGDGEVSAIERYADGKIRRREYEAMRLAARSHLVFTREYQGSVVNRLRLLAGFQVEHDWLPSFTYGQNFATDGSRDTFANHDGLPLEQRGATRTLVAPLVQAEVALLDALWLTAGLRFDAYSDFGSSLNPRIALIWAPHERFTLKALYGRAFRAPTFAELYDYTSLTPTGYRVRGDEDLRPEVTNAVELGVDWRPHDRVQLRVASFYTVTNDVIAPDPTSNLNFRDVENFPGQEIFGAEGEIRLLLDADNYLETNVSYAYRRQTGEGLDGYEQFNDLKFTNRHLTDLPELRVNTSLVMRPWTPLTVGLSHAYMSESRNNSRFQFESFVFQYVRPAHHELRGNATYRLLDDKIALAATVAVPIDKKLPVWRAYGERQIPASSWWAYLGATVRFK
ncbi:MAG: TonB-dependent receptor [Deltaproteobacteria bacterium]|jgi:outer membrane receptor for ferrienterochelin and colicin